MYTARNDNGPGHAISARNRNYGNKNEYNDPPRRRYNSRLPSETVAVAVGFRWCVLNITFFFFFAFNKKCRHITNVTNGRVHGDGGVTGRGEACLRVKVVEDRWLPRTGRAGRGEISRRARYPRLFPLRPPPPQTEPELVTNTRCIIICRNTPRWRHYYNNYSVYLSYYYSYIYYAVGCGGGRRNRRRGKKKRRKRRRRRRRKEGARGETVHDGGRGIILLWLAMVAVVTVVYLGQ